MRRIDRPIGLVAVAVGAILSAVAQAGSITHDINGTMGKLTNICFNIAVSLTNKDCSWAKTRAATTAQWRGPIEGSAFYPIGSAGDNIAYVPVANDGKLAMPLSGTVTIDDNGTPADGSDDKISATWTFGAAAFNASTGNGDRAVERWSVWTHTLAPTTVSSATPLGGGGFEYVIGSRGKPTPASLFIAGNASDTFPSENAKGTLEANPWDASTLTAIPNIADRIGIERSRGFGNGGAGVFIPNVGASTTATFTGYTCEDNPGDTDCVNAASDPTKTTSPTLFGPNRNGGGEGAPNWSAPYDGSSVDRTSGDPNAVPLSPGFSNVILILTTNGSGGISAGEAYWTREYIIANGPTIADDDEVGGPGSYLSNNSWGGGRFTFAGSGGDDLVPDPFHFIDVADAPLGTSQVSNEVVISGITVPVPVTVTGGEYAINGAAFTALAGIASDGDRVRVRHTSASAPGATIHTTLYVGGVADVFSSTTLTFGAVNDTAETRAGEPVVMDVVANDVGFVDPVIVALWQTPLHGTVTVANSPGPKSGIRLTYQPAQGFIGEDQFAYVIDDGRAVDTAVVTVRVIEDSDVDGVDQAEDNCTAIANPDQTDSNGDGYGNRCDADLDNNGFVNYVDLSLFRQQFGTAGPDADFDANGFVNFTDLAIFRGLFGKPPGPSAIAP